MIKVLSRKARALYYRHTRHTVFSKIYRQNLWSGSESRSGSGSSLQSTRLVRNQLPQLLADYGIQTLVDIPCGDFHWMQALRIGQLVKSYRGFDIVPELVANNQRRYGGSSIRFEVLDIVRQIPPPADLILCRHLLIHLPLNDCLAAIRNCKLSGSRYLLITNQPGQTENAEILWTGSFRPLNLRLPPFELPEPLMTIPDGETGESPANLSLFRLDAL